MHDFLPVGGVICMFSLSGPIIAAANPARWDAILAALDQRLFDGLPALWFHALGRPAWLTDLVSVLYFSFYVIPVAMAVALYRAGRHEEFEDLVFTIVATFVATYVGYFLMPTSGPRIPAEQAGSVLGGGAVSAALRTFLRTFEMNELDAFPSGHTTLSLVFLALGRRFFPRRRLVLVVPVGGIVFSTVYLSLHYVIDVVAGALLAGLMPILLPLIRRAVAPRRTVAAHTGGTR